MKKWSYWIFPILVMGAIFYSSSQPYQEQDIKPLLSNYIDLTFLQPYLEWISFTYHQSEVSIETHGVHGLIEFFIRKGAHVTVFLLLFLAFYVAYKHTLKKSVKRVLFISLFSTVAYAISDELHQGITPNRTPYIGDVFLDSFGALIGLGLILLFRRRKGY